MLQGVPYAMPSSLGYYFGQMCFKYFCRAVAEKIKLLNYYSINLIASLQFYAF